MKTIHPKKGLSDSVSAMLMILLALIAIGIIWFGIQAILKNTQGSIDTLKVLLNIEEESTQINPDLTISIKVSRGIGEGNLTAINFIISNDQGEEVQKVESNLGELESETFTITPTLENVKIISIAPVGIVSGKIQIGQIKDSYVFN